MASALSYNLDAEMKITFNGSLEPTLGAELELQIIDPETHVEPELIQSLVVWLGDRYDEGTYLSLQRYWIVRENKWRAAHWSTETEIIVDEDGRLEPLSDSVERLIEEVTPVAQRLGCANELAGLETILKTGSSYRRQRRLYEETWNFLSVMESLVDESRQSVRA